MKPESGLYGERAGCDARDSSTVAGWFEGFSLLASPSDVTRVIGGNVGGKFEEDEEGGRASGGGYTFRRKG